MSRKEGEISQYVKSLLCNFKELSLDYQNPHKKLVYDISASNLSAEWGDRDSQIAMASRSTSLANW